MKSFLLLYLSFTLLITPLAFAKNNGSQKTAKEYFYFGMTEYAVSKQALSIEERNNNLNEAIKYFDEALKLEPGYKDALLGKAKAYLDLGNPQESLTWLDKYKQDNSQNDEYLLIKAKAHANLNQDIESIKAFNEATKINKNNPVPFFERGIFWFESGNYKKALYDFKKAKELNSQVKNIDGYIRGSSIVIRHLDGTNIPPKNWKFNGKNNFSIMRGSELLAYIPELSEKEKGGILIKFNGTEEKPYEFIYNFYIWKGSIIKDDKYGVLLNNGTSFKHIITLENGDKLERIGIIEHWKAKITAQKKLN